MEQLPSAGPGEVDDRVATEYDEPSRILVRLERSQYPPVARRGVQGDEMRSQQVEQ